MLKPPICKKILSFLLIIFIVLPVISLQPIKAHAQTYTVITSGIDQAYVDSLGSNILSNITPICRTLSGQEIQPDIGEISYMTDGIVFQTSPHRLKVDFYQSQMTITYDMGMVVTCNKILVVGMYATFGDYGLGQYELYISNSSETLYNQENKIASYDNYGRWSPTIPNSGAAALFDLHSNPAGRYFGIKVLKSDYNDDGYNDIRIDELAVYGCAPITNGIDQSYYTDLGENLLSGKTPVCKTIGGQVIQPDSGQVSYMTDGIVFENIPSLKKADFYRQQMTITYDIGMYITCDKVFVAGMYAEFGNYGLGQYEIYFSNSADTLYDAENRVITYDNEGMWSPSIPYSGAAAVFELYNKPAGRYFGIKILKPDYNDDGYTVIRVDELAVFGIVPKTSGIDQTYLTDLGENLLSNITPVCKNMDGEIVQPDEGEISYMTDGIIFQTTPHRLKVDFYLPQMTIAYDMGTTVQCGKVLVAGMYATFGDFGLGQYELYFSDSLTTLFDSHNKVAAYDNAGMWSASVPNSGAAAVFEFYSKPSGRYFGIKILKPDYNDDGYTVIRIDELAVYAYKRTVSVDTANIINSDFLGIGVNIVPTSLMPTSLAHGYNEAYWEMDKKRILMMKPKVCRVLFQTDWVELTKGTYTWNTPKMIAFCKYLDVLKSAGSEVELNFGWKVATGIQSWFSIPGVSDPANSAPADLNAFAAACSETLNYLINVKGYNNIKYLSFYNEPNYNEFLCNSDDPLVKKAYYAEMIRIVSNKLLAGGRRNLVKIWAAEDASKKTEWFDYLKQHSDAYLDGYSYHTYGLSFARLKTFLMARISSVSPKPVFLTEFGWANEDESGWDGGYSNYVINGANNGLSSLLAWQLNGTWLEDPLINGCTDGSNLNLWDSLPSGGILPYQSYYEISMLSRYIPQHSQVLSTSTNDLNTRATAFKTASGDYTVLIESKGGSANALHIDFNGASIGKTFRKHVYYPSIAKEGNTLIPVVSGSFYSCSSFTDSNVSSDYCIIVYTTLPAQTQVIVNPVYAEISARSQLQLSAAVVDNAGGVSWSIASGSGTVSGSGLYTPSPNAQIGDMIALKATSNSDPNAYGIALIKITSIN